MKTTDRQALVNWDDFKKTILASTSIDTNETDEEREKRIAYLEEHQEEWFKYYFPTYYSSNPAPFQVQSTKRVLSNPTWYEVRAWSRECAKTSRAMMECLYLTLVKGRKNVLYVSNCWDNAKDLLMPIMINLETNQRIINDYGKQEGLYNWEAGLFKTNEGVSYRAIGAGQSPRGSKNEFARPDIIIIDDIDTDEEVRNLKIIKNKWNWVEQALIPCVSISGNWLILFLGNIIAKDTTITRASKVADCFSIVNIRDKKGRSTWPERNTEENIDRILSKLSFASQQKEYYNNPIEEGTTFKEVAWDKVPPMQKFKFLVSYGDPAPSNKENKANCHKACFLMGVLEDTLYIFTGYLAHVKNSEFVEWYYNLESYVKDRTQVYNNIENNSLQDPFYEQVFKPLFKEKGKEKGYYINITPDDRKKPDKFARIEGNLEPKNRDRKIIFNIAEKNNPHMVLLEQQFLGVDPQLNSPVDGPDCIEGGLWIINEKLKKMAKMTSVPRTSIINKKRY
jgi:hypothetical protein